MEVGRPFTNEDGPEKNRKGRREKGLGLSMGYRINLPRRKIFYKGWRIFNSGRE
jgi:hypothetical protein